MKQELVDAYQAQLLTMFEDVQADFSGKSFGLKASIIEKTIPVMLFEGRRENGKDDLPLLSEAVKNLIMATSVLMFGWDKSCALHLRVTLENIMYGVNIFSEKELRQKLERGEEIGYVKMSKLVENFTISSPQATTISGHFALRNLITQTYSELSKWSHTLGAEFCYTLPLLGYQDLKRKRIGEINRVYENVIRIAVLVYLTCNPSILGDFGKADQRKLLGPLSLPERKFLRDTLSI